MLEGVRRVGFAGSPAPSASACCSPGWCPSFASANPDGLEYVAERVGFLDTARDSAVAGSPFSDYALVGIDNPVLATGLAGVLGVAIALAVGVLVARAVRPRGRGTGSRTREPEQV